MMLGYDMCLHVWKECNVGKDVELIFVDGGVNEMNPFSINTIKNEFNVYCSSFKDIVESTKTNILTVDSFCERVNKDDSILMDMNGSMAFYNDSFQKLVKDNLLKKVCIMGGVLDDQPPDTLSTTPFLNRFATATMNQLYSNNKTYNFMIDLQNIYCDIVSNNEINYGFTYPLIEGRADMSKRNDYFNEYKTAMTTMGLLPNNNDSITVKLFDAFYNARNVYDDYIVPLPFKPFDVLSALTLVNPNLNRNLSLLYYQKTYGCTIIQPNYRQPYKNVEGIMKGLLEKHNKSPYQPEFIRNGIKEEIDTFKNDKFMQDVSIYPVYNNIYRTPVIQQKSGLEQRAAVRSYIESIITGGRVGGSRRYVRKSLDNCTVVELRERAAKRGVNVYGLRKAEIIAKLRRR